MLKLIAVFKKILEIFCNQRIKFKILSLYLTTIILSIVMVSWIIYGSTERQLKHNVYQITNDAVNQISLNISDKLGIIAEQLVKTKFDAELEHLINLDISDISEQESAEAVVHFKKIFDEIYSLGNNYELIHSMIIYLNNGMRFQFEEGKYFFCNQKLLNSEIQKYCNGDQNYFWRNAHNDTVFFEGSGARVLSVSSPVRKGEKIAALVIVNMNESYMKKLIGRINLANTGSVVMVSKDGYLTNQNYKYLAGLESMIDDRVLHNFRESDQFEYKLKKFNFLIVYDTIRVNGWKLALVLKKSDMMRNVDQVKSEIICFTLIILLLAVIATFLIAHGLTKPINKLSKLMAVVETGNLDIRFNTKYNDEIGTLTRQFNSMLERIQLLVRKVEEEQTQKRRMELKTLQMQIDPHFLYNTLDSIKFLADQKSDNTSKMVMALGQFYKHCLSKGDGITTVGEEVDHLKSYLTIQKIRYFTQFDYQIEVDESLLSCQTVKFILQPLVENAIYHGIKKKHGKGVINIKGYREEDKLVFNVYDNGAGIAPARLEVIRNSLKRSNTTNEVGIGVFNVHKRIVMNYGDEYGLSITSVQNEFTLLTVKHPIVVKTLEE
jgi:two-component system sensor histidine kinase YesM